MAIIMDGKKLANEIRQSLKQRVDHIKACGYNTTLTIIQVGHNPASDIYVHNKQKACEEIGIFCYSAVLDEHIGQENLNTFVQNLYSHGVMLQLPVPNHLCADEVIEYITPELDVDGLHPLNAGLLLQNQKGFVPCTPKGIIRLLKEYNVPLAGKHAVVVGRSNIVGKPISILLLNENCTVTMCHSKTECLTNYTRQADILISAVGKPHLITADMVKPGAAVLDVGINRVDGKLVGDVDFENVEKVAGWITPVPGGVGPMTVAMLMENTVEAAERSIRGEEK